MTNDERAFLGGWVCATEFVDRTVKIYGPYNDGARQNCLAYQWGAEKSKHNGSFTQGMIAAVKAAFGG
jgi:hypothetical protein